MEIIFRKNTRIINKSNWEIAWYPKSEKQWKDGRSSKEFAKYALSDSFVSLISQIIRECGIKEQILYAEPEAKSSLGKGFCSGGCRNHDLLMIGNDCVIGIEAKVDESFDKNWEDALASQKKKNRESNTRAYKLRNYLATGKDVNDIGYQLFTAVRGTIYSAITNKKKKCIFLVIVFDGEIKPNEKFEDKVEKNRADFIKFCKATDANKGFINRDGIECWLKEVKVTISKDYSYSFAEMKV